MFLVTFILPVFEFGQTFLVLIKQSLRLLKLLLDGAEEPLGLSGLLLKRAHGGADVAIHGLALQHIGVHRDFLS